MKKAISLICAAALLLAACRGPADAKVSVSDVVADNKIEGEITVSCYDTMSYQSFLEEAAKAFEEKYPGTKVNVESFAEMPEIKTREENGMQMAIITNEEDPQAKSDYINKISTELMSGKGADVLAIDILPFYKYAANGQLDNLREYMDNDASFNIDDYRTNLFDAISDDNGQFALPIDYSFDYFAYDSSLFTESQQEALKSADKLSTEQIVELGREAFAEVNTDNSDPTYMFGLNEGAERDGMFRTLFLQNYSDFIDINSKKVNFKDGEFVSLFDRVKEYADEGIIKTGSGGNMVNRGEIGADLDSMELTPEMFGKNESERYLLKTQSSEMLMQAFNKNSRMRMMSVGMGNTENDEISSIVANNKGEVSYTYSQAYGINSNSQNKNTAWEFIKFLLSDEMQESLNLRGLPVNKEAFLNKTKMSITGELYANAAKSGGGGMRVKTSGAAEGGEPKEAPVLEYMTELDEEGQKVFDDYVAQVEKYTSQINAFFITDSSIEEAVVGEVKNFFSSSKTAEEVADALQNRISLYLNE